MNIPMMTAGRSLALVSVFAMGATGLHAQTAPVGDQAYPEFGQCTGNGIPDMPTAWSANALLTPFQSQPLQVARVSFQQVDGFEPRMVITTDEVQGAGPLGWYIQGDRTYALSTSNDGDLECNLTTNTPTPWVAPAADWLSSKPKAEACSCAGANNVTGVEAEAWRCPNGQNLSNGEPEFDWFWYTKDTNRSLLRIINSRANNTQSLPVLGDASLVNFTDVVPTADPLLAAATSVCNQKIPVKATLPSPGIQGLSYDPDNAPTPPTWMPMALCLPLMAAIPAWRFTTTGTPSKKSPRSSRL